MVHIRKLALINWHNKIIKTVTLLFSRRKKFDSRFRLPLQSSEQLRRPSCRGLHLQETYCKRLFDSSVGSFLKFFKFIFLSLSIFFLSKYLLPPSLATGLWSLCRSVSSTQRCRQLLKPTGGDGGWWVFIWPDQGPSIAFSLVWNSRLRFEWSGQ